MAKPGFTLPQELSRAISTYNAGQLVEAEQMCQTIIHTKRDLFDALYLLAVSYKKSWAKKTRRW